MGLVGCLSIGFGSAYARQRGVGSGLAALTPRATDTSWGKRSSIWLIGIVGVYTVALYHQELLSAIGVMSRAV